MKLYEKLVEEIEGMVTRGVLKPGERVLSVRRTSEQYKLSITTVVRAFLLLKSRGVIESRPQSGYFVSRDAPVDANGTEPSSQDGPTGSADGNSNDGSGRRTSSGSMSSASSTKLGARRRACPGEPVRRSKGVQLDPQLVAFAAACDPFARAIRLPAVRALVTTMDV